MVDTQSLHTKVYNHLLERVRGLRARELDFDRVSDQARLVPSAKTHAPGGIEIGAGVALFEESAQRREGRPRELTEWSWIARFGFDVAVDSQSIMDALAADTLVAADLELGTAPFRASLLSVTALEQPRQSEETGTHFEVEFTLERQRL